jgi:hypothetical protein
MERWSGGFIEIPYANQIGLVLLGYIFDCLGVTFKQWQKSFDMRLNAGV